VDLAVTSYLGHFKNSWLIDWLIVSCIISRHKSSTLLHVYANCDRSNCFGQSSRKSRDHWVGFDTLIGNANSLVISCHNTLQLLYLLIVKEVHLYSAFIVVPHTQGVQVRITQCYLQITPYRYLPLPRKRLPDGASPDRLRTSNCSLLLIYLPRKDERLSGPGWLTYSGRFTHISGHPSAAGRARTGKVRRSKTDVLPLCHASNPMRQPQGVDGTER